MRKSVLTQPRTSLGTSDVSWPMDAGREDSVSAARSIFFANASLWGEEPRSLLLLVSTAQSLSKMGASQWYCQVRGKLVDQFFGFFSPFRGSFSAVSTPIFATKGAFFSVFRALHVFLCTIPDFSDFSGPLHRFCKIQCIFR